MGIIILFSVMLIIGIGLIVWGHNDFYDDWKPFVGTIITILCVVALLIAICCTATLKEHFAYTESQYNNLKEQIEYCDRDDIVTDGNLRKQVLDMNNTIAKHREYCHNFWIGLYYSERIGSLENLKWKSNKE